MTLSLEKKTRFWEALNARSRMARLRASSSSLLTGDASLVALTGSTSFYKESIFLNTTIRLPFIIRLRAMVTFHFDIIYPTRVCFLSCVAQFF